MKYFGVVLIIAILAFASFFYFKQNSLPVSSNTTVKDFVINQGDGLNIISTRLQTNGLIRNKYVFLLLSHQLKLNNSLKAGLFHLSPSMST